MVRKWLAVTVLCAGVLWPACKSASPEAREREQLLADDALKGLAVPGGELRRETSTAGKSGGDDDVTVKRVYTVSGDLKAAAVSVLQQAREFGWTVTANCDAAGDDFVLLGVKDVEGFQATFSAVVWVRPQTGEPEVEVEITAPYPDDEPEPPPSQTFPPQTCLDA